MEHDEWHNEEYMANKKAEVVHVSKDLIENKLGIIEGVRKLSKLHHIVSKDVFDPDFLIFTAIDSETDHLPIRAVRKHWSLSALEMKDKEISEAEHLYKEQVIKACRNLISKQKNYNSLINRTWLKCLPGRSSTRVSSRV
jgi:hypothetical protein